jgi:hypothetical protein
MNTISNDLRRLKSWFEKFRPRRLELSLLCLLLLFTSSCGGSGETTPSTPLSNGTSSSGGAKSTDNNKAPNVDACTLVTRSEADSIMGKLREEPKPVTALRDEKTCSYLNMDGASATIRVYGAGQFESQKGIDSEEKMTSLSGLGDEAYYTKKGSDTDLWARKGGVTINVNSSIGLEKSKGMAQKALSRL